MIVLGITMGDPAGIGPEIAVKALAGSALAADCRICVIGDSAIMKQAAATVGCSREIHSMESADDFCESAINVLSQDAVAPGSFSMGAASAECGRAAYAYITKAIALAQQGAIDAVVTNPINKEALKMAGIDYPGHTEIFADKTGASNYSMVFLLDKVAVAHVTTHCSLRQAIALIDTSRVYKNIELLNSALTAMGTASPRIAVAGLNPHAGEHGLFGNEEIDHIIPAIEQALRNGINCTGPLPPDTVFMRSFKGEFDGVVSMLHDHGFVALKSRDFDSGVNITIGLPILRTSVGHGTAFDLAGTGKANEKSLVQAIKIAAQMAGRRQ